MEPSARSTEAPDSAPADNQRVIVAAVQMTATADVRRNLDRVALLCQRAQARGARLVVLPENFALLASDETLKHRYAVQLSAGDGAGQILDEMRALASQLGLHLVLGGFPSKSADERRVYNACVSLDPHGAITATYRKIHLFDVDFASAATTLRRLRPAQLRHWPGLLLRTDAAIKGARPEQPWDLLLQCTLALCGQPIFLPI